MLFRSRLQALGVAEIPYGDQNIQLVDLTEEEWYEYDQAQCTYLLYETMLETVLTIAESK